MKIALIALLVFLSGCTCGTNIGYLTGTTVGIEISTGATNTTAPITFVLGYRRVEALVTPTGTTKVPSVLSTVDGSINTGDANIGMQGKQFFAVGDAATALAEEIK
jgi:hypothetical protein